MAWDRQWVLQLSVSLLMSLVQGLNQEYQRWSEMDVFVSCTCQISSKVASYCEQWKVVIDARRFKVDESKKFVITSAHLFQACHHQVATPSQLLSLSSPTSLLETLTITICWECEQPGDLQAFLSPNSGWSTLEETLTSNKFISLRQVSFKLDSSEAISSRLELELRRSSARPYINPLFPMLRALSNTQGTPEINIQIWGKS